MQPASELPKSLANSSGHNVLDLHRQKLANAASAYVGLHRESVIVTPVLKLLYNFQQRLRTFKQNVTHICHIMILCATHPVNFDILTLCDRSMNYKWNPPGCGPEWPITVHD